MKYPQTARQRKALEAIRKGGLVRAAAAMELQCWMCGREETMTRNDGRAAGWKLGKIRTVRRGVQEQVDLCPGCDLGRGASDRSSAGGP